MMKVESHSPGGVAQLGSLAALGVSICELHCHTNYMKKHTLVLGASIGFATGLIMFGVGLWLSYQPGSSLIPPFLLVHRPALAVLALIHDVASYDWRSPAGLTQIFAAFLVYWTLLGTLAGSGWRAISRDARN